MVLRIALLSRMEETIPSSEGLSRMIPAVSLAMSDPAPMTIEASATASDGASLIPSPAMAVRHPSFFQPESRVAFSAGESSPWHSVMPSSRATVLAVLARSPVSIATRMPILPSMSMSPLAEGRMVSRKRKMPAGWPSTAMATTPSPGSVVMESKRAASTPCMARNDGEPISTRWSSTVAEMPPPGWATKFFAWAASMPRLRACLTRDRARGCSLPSSAPEARARRRSPVMPQSGRGMTPRSSGVPSVRVPVLSSARRSVCARLCRAEAERTRIPW